MAFKKGPTKEQVLAARKAASLTQDRAADLVGTYTRTWQKWEAGQGGMSYAAYNYFLQKTK